MTSRKRHHVIQALNSILESILDVISGIYMSVVESLNSIISFVFYIDPKFEQYLFS